MTQRSFSADQQLSQAKKLARQGDIEAAKRLYGEILAQFPQNKKARKELKALQERGGSQLSREDFERIMRLFHSSKLDAAQADASQLIRLHRGQPALHNLLAVILIRQNKLEAAIEQLGIALQLQPDFSDAINNLGSAYTKLGHTEQAQRCYLSLLQAEPRDPDAWFNLGNVQRKQGELSDAINSYQRSIQLRPLSADAHYELGRSHLDLGAIEQAIVNFQDALGIRENFLPARKSLAKAYLSLGKYSAAGDCYKQILQAQPEDSDALLGLADCQRLLGIYSAAAQTYRQVLALAPDSSAAKEQLDAIEKRNDTKRRDDMTLNAIVKQLHQVKQALD